jgi:hypothetical protein
VVVAAVVLVVAARFFPLVGRLAYLFIGVGWLAVLLIGGLHVVLRLLRRRGVTAPRLGLLPFGAAVSLLLTGVASALLLQFSGPPPVPGSDLAPSAQLRYLHETDQGDRAAARFLTLGARDAQRRQRVQALAADGRVVSARDALSAALVLHHGTDPAHYARAHRFARRAEAGGERGGQWLRKATYDRWMLSLGKPQQFGTQSRAAIGQSSA